VGNKVPHPAVIFFILAGLVIALSHLFYLLGSLMARFLPIPAHRYGLRDSRSADEIR